MLLPLLLLSTALAGDTWVRTTPASWGGQLSWEGDRIVVLTGTGEVLSYSDDGEALATWSTHKWGTASASMSADGRRVLTVDYKGRVEVRETDTGARLVRWKGGSRWSSPSAVLSPDGRLALYADDRVELRPVDGGPSTTLWDAVAANAELMGFLGDDTLYAPADYSGVGTWTLSGADAGPRVPLMDSMSTLVPAGDHLLHVTWEGRLLRVDPEAGSTERLQVPGFSGEPYDVSADGQRLAFVVFDDEMSSGELAIWDLEAGALVGGVPTPADGLQSFAFSPDGRRVAMLSNGALRVAAVPQAPQSVPPGWMPLTMGITEDGRALVAVYPTGLVRSWWLDGGEPRRSSQVPLAGASWGPSAAALRPGARELAFVDVDGAVVTWDLERGERRAVLMPQTESEVELVYGLDGSLAAVSYDKVALWDPEGLLVGQVSISDADKLAVGPGGQTLALASWQGDVSLLSADGSIRWTRKVENYLTGLYALPDGSLLVLDPSAQPQLLDAEGQRRSEAPGIMIGAQGMDEVQASALTPDGGVLFLSGAEGDLLRRQLPDTQWRGEVVHNWPWEARLGYLRLAAHPDGQHVVTADRSGSLQLWDLGGEGEPALEFSYAAPRPGALAVAGDAERLFIARAEGLVEVVSRGGEPLASFQLDAEIIDLDLSPDGTRLAVVLADGGVLTLPAMGGEPYWELELFEWMSRAVSFSPDGRSVAAIDDIGNVALLDAASGAPVPRYSPPWWASGLAWDDEGRLVTWAEQGFLTWTDGEWSEQRVPRKRRWEIDGALASCGGRVVVNASGYGEKPVPAVYVTKQGTSGRLRGSALTRLPSERVACAAGRIALGTGGGDVWVLDLETGERLSVLPGDGSVLSDLIVLPDGAVVTTSVAGRARLWDGATGELEREWVRVDETHPPAPVEEAPEAPEGSEGSEGSEGAKAYPERSKLLEAVIGTRSGGGTVQDVFKDEALDPVFDKYIEEGVIQVIPEGEAPAEAPARKPPGPE